jgi:hypothetical protein
MDGRILYEALNNQQQEPPKPVERTIEASRVLGFLRWHQYLKFTQVGYTVYYEEGNGQARLKEESEAK